MKSKILSILQWLALIGSIIVGAAFVAFVIVIFIIGGMEFVRGIKNHQSRPAEMQAEEPAEGIGRVTAARYLAEKVYEEQIVHKIDTYTEWEGTAPHWYRPWEPMATEWSVDFQQDLTTFQQDSADYNAQANAHSPAGIDPGGVDWNIETEIVGWDGHRMAVWETDLFSRIVYLEFWGTSRECVEAGIDSMLLLWDMGEYGRTMGELLSAQYAPGYYVYSPYAYVWDWDYDAEGLAEIRAMCEERFAAGPEWCAPYFRLWYYHVFGIPAYEIDGVYFSAAKE